MYVGLISKHEMKHFLKGYIWLSSHLVLLTILLCVLVKNVPAVSGWIHSFPTNPEKCAFEKEKKKSDRD